MLLTIRFLFGKDFFLQIDKDASIQEIKEIIFKERNIPVKYQRLIWKGIEYHNKFPDIVMDESSCIIAPYLFVKEPHEK